jgi:hypothetical protein
MDRWRAYQADPDYRSFFDRDPDLARLSEEYFQFNPRAAPLAAPSGKGYVMVI